MPCIRFRQNLDLQFTVIFFLHLISFVKQILISTHTGKTNTYKNQSRRICVRAITVTEGIIIMRIKYRKKFVSIFLYQDISLDLTATEMQSSSTEAWLIHICTFCNSW